MRPYLFREPSQGCRAKGGSAKDSPTSRTSTPVDDVIPPAAGR
ncbi:MAG: hypothetical protein ABII09_03310 [Planctomycetota bacterium]